MRTDLDHLTVAKGQELARVLSILFDEFGNALAGRNAPHAKTARILKVILFGSYARGDWVLDPDGGYISDFDILVVVNNEEAADTTEYWRGAEDHLLRELESGGLVRTPVNLIVHSLADVNSRLKRGRPFFIDIVRDGIALHDTPDYPFDSSKPLSPEASLAEAQGYFDEWFGSAAGFADTASYAARQDRPKEAAFQLHQATERLYHCTLLVLTLYSPKSHKLNFLRSQAERLAPALIPAWPRDSRFAQRCFELLRRAYVDARYSPHYRISTEELVWLIERIDDLQGLVEQVCLEHLHR
ncbi:HEPN domain-containing protein [Sphingomonas sp. NPDC079357]|uniref:HEPN domain-containing protein n=1 Tax=Sphingomonas sp. NPDC079357 TaxID=3364518 RepID=UPI00384D955F